jgi:dinuclear metal center YbgI/SA1388 family protein
MSVHGQTIIQWIEQLAPKHLAEDWDNVGLLVGSLHKQVSKVLTTLDVTEEVVQEAIDHRIDLIIAHHPLIFRPLTHVRTDLPQGRMLAQLLKHDIAVYVAHTNLDIANGGLNDWLAASLNLRDIKVMAATDQEQLKKLAVFVPKAEEQKVRAALGQAGAGFIGQYSHCTFRTEGIGTFLPLEGTNPYIGEQGKIEQVEEVKIETLFPASIEKRVIQAMLKAHPYEEVAYDVYTLDQKGETYGLGRVGKLEHEMTVKQLVAQLKETWGISHCRVVGSPDQTVSQVAVLGGSGSKFVGKALFSGADVLITGDIDYHTAHDALMNGLIVIDAGHFIEKIMVGELRKYLQQKASEQKAQLDILATSVAVDPFLPM